MAVQSLELLRGTLDLLILRALTRGRLHGFAVMRFLEEATGSALQVEEGSLYPARYRLEEAARTMSREAIGFPERKHPAEPAMASPLTCPVCLGATNPATQNVDATPRSADDFEPLIQRLLNVQRPRYRRMWAYYRNPLRVVASSGSDDAAGDRPYRQAQEWGLPARITGACAGSDDVFAAEPIDGVSRKEVVIENDIGWRVETMVDYLFGKPLVINSAAPDPQRRQMLSELLRLILAHSGGILLLQQLALIGSVYGFVDLLVKLEPGSDEGPSAGRAAPCVQHLGQPPACEDTLPTPDGAGPSAGSAAEPVLMSAGPVPGSDDGATPDLDAGASHPSPQSSARSASSSAELERLARMVRLEVVEPARALPLLDGNDWRVVRAYAQCFETTSSDANEVATTPGTWIDRLRRTTAGVFGQRRSAARDGTAMTLEIITPTIWQRCVGGRVVAHGGNSLGQIPLVHIQNTSVPFEYTGAGDVEGLIPLQDELNTRLSDRAHRITMQSFRMYLGKGIENFGQMPVAPGRMWSSAEPDAEVIEFGGDAGCPSEESHIADIREAMDKSSGVTPIAAGAIKGRIGRLTSAAALRVTMQSLLARTEKKRTTYGAAIARICELALAWLDVAGLFPTTSQERRVELSWPSPLPENRIERLQEARAKLGVGVSAEVVLRELGY
jgi:hypothetical protein